MAVMDIFPALFDGHFIKVIFLVHATLYSLANIQSYSNGNSIGYSTYNILFLITILLSVLVDKNIDIVLISTAFNVICMALDLVLLFSSSGIGTFTTLWIVTNLVLRPVSTILLLKNYSSRAGVEDPTNGFLEVNVAPSLAPRARSAYQNIDEPSQNLP